MRMDKSKLRERYIEVRRDLAQASVQQWSGLITAAVIRQIPWPAVRRMHIYDSKTQWNEVGTRLLIDHVRSVYPDIELTIGFASRTAPLPDGSFDVVIVPLLAFDTTLTRLGFGGGWYDRFLGLQPEALKIGVAFDVQEAGSIPSELFDVPLDMVVTNTRVVMRSASRR